MDCTLLFHSPVKRSTVLAVLLLVLSVALALLLRRFGWLDPVRIGSLAVRVRHGHDPSVTAPLFVLALAGATALGAPGSPFMLAAGVLFDVGTGALLSLVGALLGGVAGYGLARRIGRGAIDRYVRRHRRLERNLRANGFWTMLRMRLLPIVPLSVGNFVAGLARMPIGAFLLATLLGVAPFAAIYAYLASTLLWGAEATQRSAVWSLAIGSAALVAISFLPDAARRFRRARRARVGA